LNAQPPDAEGSLCNGCPWTKRWQRMIRTARPILLDFYTSWCGWCKQMMKTTYADPRLAQYINTYFYPAKFNAEGKDTLEFLEKNTVCFHSSPVSA
jgi:thiol:disulfide interchange protein